ncbi:MAG TPA: methyltransferase domain-containing protein, partial [Lamprocystis sp. (in: g-proteobacteria)]|nr:methyltransferase domain-containing protein [Lamprocystis sp. (in: g-proteobacteria)]
MQFINTQVAQDLAEGRPLKIDLGSGGAAANGFYAVDHLPLPGVDIVADLNAPLDLLPDNCVAHLTTRHALEHVREFLGLMREIHRITKPGGTVDILVPHFSNVFGFSDPTHVRFFGLHTMFYFVAAEHQQGTRKLPAFYTDVRFRIRSIRIEFYRIGWFDKLVVPLLTRLVNRSFAAQ